MECTPYLAASTVGALAGMDDRAGRNLIETHQVPQRFGRIRALPWEAGLAAVWPLPDHDLYAGS